LINNAGIAYIQPFENNKDEHIDEIFRINVMSHIKLTQKIYPLMKKQKAGHIINIISSAGMEAKYNHTLYCATKFAMRGFTDSLRLEAKRYRIKVTGVYPGGIRTNIFRNVDRTIDQSTFMKAADVAKAIYSISEVGDICPDYLTISRMTWKKDALYG
jgi:short-subunit dehydrogenase